MFPLNFKPNLIVAPFKANLRDSGQPLTFSQAQALVANGQANSLHIERSHPGSAEAAGWTFFEQTGWRWLHTGGQLYQAERDARRQIHKAQSVHPGSNHAAGPACSQLRF
jgi:hypothetical protein